MGETRGPLPPALQAFLSQGPLSPGQPPHLLPHRLSAAALPILGPVPPALELGPATEPHL